MKLVYLYALDLNDIWNRRLQNPIRQENVEQFKAKVNAYEERGFSSDKAIHLAANDDLPSLRKKLRRDYAQFLIDYYKLQEDPVQQRILESAKTFKNQHGYESGRLYQTSHQTQKRFIYGHMAES